jgi:pyruvate kinase
MGPKCWSEDVIGELLDAGMNMARFNFSHGDHAGHGGVLERVRKVCAAKGVTCATMLDTKGPEIRTAMLRNHKAIELEAGQEIIVQAVGDDYVNFEGYKTDMETRIGLSYAGLCKSVAPGKRILLADGTISIEVIEILNATELRGRVLNNKKLGERKNCNLPGVKVDIPVLTEKDIDDLQNFGCKLGVDFVAASFVQSADDVKFIRRVLDEKGGQGIRIISKIENQAGLNNFDEILKYTDGVMVARGDLGMEIPSWKVPQAQKMLITKCNIAGKFVITATQMLESMCGNPLPTRAEMTDVANAVFDGTDAVMLSGETANGDFPRVAVETMAAIVLNAELGVDYYSQFSFIQYWNTQGKKRTVSAEESTLSSVSKMAVDFSEDTNGDASNDGVLIIVLTETGAAADLITKVRMPGALRLLARSRSLRASQYRPPFPVVVVSPNAQTLRQCSGRFGQYAFSPASWASLDDVGREAVEWAREMELVPKARKIIIAHGAHALSADASPVLKIFRGDGIAMKRRKLSRSQSGATLQGPTGVPVARSGTASLRSTSISLSSIIEPLTKPRSTKIVCTLGPKCWSEEALHSLLDAGMNLARFNFSHGDHKAHGEVLERFRKVCNEHAAAFSKEKGMDKAPVWATMLDTKGPEIRTAMLRNHEAIMLEANQEIIVQAVGDAYTTFEGYKTDVETRIGLSYAGLCQSMSPGKRILIADGTISIEVLDILSETELRGRVLNSNKLGERKNCNLPGVKVDIPVLTSKDIDDLQNFCCKHEMDFVAASFVQSAEDVKFIRSVLDDAGGKNVKIISKIENQAGLANFDEILKFTDGVMVARGDLGMEIPSEKVALAQKMLITKCTIAGKFVITATQMLESMITNPLPTRAEMTDVANAVFDGTDAVMLSGETANGDFPREAVATMAAIVTNAEHAQNNRSLYNFIRNHTSKPMTDVEAICSSAVQTVRACVACRRPGLALTCAQTGDGHGRSRDCAAHLLRPHLAPGGQVPA